MQVHHLVLGMFETNCYIVSGGHLGKCLVIDPAAEGERLVGYLQKEGLVPEAILLTHGHYDHFLAIAELQQCWPELPVYCHPKDCPEEKEEYDRDMRMTFPTVSAFSRVKPLCEDMTLVLAGWEIQVMETPGHTPGSVVFMIEDAMFTGDTLFCGSIGRTDFAGGNVRQMGESLRRLAGISGDYDVYPGHEELTTLKKEKQYNQYLKLL